jgi:ComF family protein
MKRLLDWCLPNLCLWCLQPLSGADLQICAHCSAQLPRLSLQRDQLSHCQIANNLLDFQLDGLLAVSWYQLPWSRWIVQWKFHRDLAAAQALLHEFQSACLYWQQLGLTADAVAYVPMQRWRRWWRGFNQAEQLAQVAANTLQLPLWHGLKSTQRWHQVGHSGSSRRQRQRRFKLGTTAVPRHLLLVDDVLTTGSTCNQLAQLLKAAGCDTIIVLTLAITPPPWLMQTQVN